MQVCFQGAEVSTHVIQCLLFFAFDINVVLQLQHNDIHELSDSKTHIIQRAQQGMGSEPGIQTLRYMKATAVELIMVGDSGNMLTSPKILFLLRPFLDKN